MLAAHIADFDIILEENENQNLEVVTQLRELKDLRDQGIINDDEFKKAKDKILK